MQYAVEIIKVNGCAMHTVHKQWALTNSIDYGNTPQYLVVLFSCACVISTLFHQHSQQLINCKPALKRNFAVECFRSYLVQSVMMHLMKRGPFFMDFNAFERSTIINMVCQSIPWISQPFYRLFIINAVGTQKSLHQEKLAQRKRNQIILFRPLVVWLFCMRLL